VYSVPVPASELSLALDPHFGCNRPGIAHGFDVINLVFHLQRVEVAAENAVAVKIELAALLGEQKAEILLGDDLRHLTEILVFRIVRRFLGATLALVLELQELALGDPERLVDGIAQIRTLEFLQQMIRFVTHNDILAAGNAQLDVHDRRDGVVAIAGALVDARKIIVEGAVEIVNEAVQLLEKRQLGLTGENRERLVTNLLTVICGDAKVQPTVQMSSAEKKEDLAPVLERMVQRLEKLPVANGKA